MTTDVRRLWWLAAVLAALYVVACIKVEAVLYGDFADHIARAGILADLIFDGGRRFGAEFEFRFLAVPYVLGDLLLMLGVHGLGMPAATAVWTALNVLALPLAVTAWLVTARVDERLRPLAFIISLYLATDWFFLCGFLSFHLAVALVVLAMALVHSLRRDLRAGTYLAYTAVVFAGYLMHLSFVLFLVVAVGLSGLFRLWRRETRFTRELLWAAPVVLVSAWHLVTLNLYPEARQVVEAHFDWGTVRSKIARLDWDIVRLNAGVDILLAALIAVACAWPAIRLKRAGHLRPSALSWESGLVAIGFGALYVVMPMRYGDPTYLDVRGLAAAMPFGYLALLTLADSGGGKPSAAPTRLATALLVVAAVANLAYLVNGLAPRQAWLRDYRAVAAAIPAGARVLPVTTHPREGQWRPNLHVAALAVVWDRGAWIPDLFSGDRGQPMKYFRYRNPRNAPPDFWYFTDPPMDVQWQQIECDYEYVLATQPFNPQKLAFALRQVTSNSAATLLATTGSCADRRQTEQ